MRPTIEVTDASVWFEDDNNGTQTYMHPIEVLVSENVNADGSVRFALVFDGTVTIKPNEDEVSLARFVVEEVLG